MFNMALLNSAMFSFVFLQATFFIAATAAANVAPKVDRTLSLQPNTDQPDQSSLSNSLRSLFNCPATPCSFICQGACRICPDASWCPWCVDPYCQGPPASNEVLDSSASTNIQLSENQVTSQPSKSHGFNRWSINFVDCNKSPCDPGCRSECNLVCWTGFCPSWCYAPCHASRHFPLESANSKIDTRSRSIEGNKPKITRDEPSCYEDCLEQANCDGYVHCEKLCDQICEDGVIPMRSAYNKVQVATEPSKNQGILGRRFAGWKPKCNGEPCSRECRRKCNYCAPFLCPWCRHSCAPSTSTTKATTPVPKKREPEFRTYA